MPSFSFHPRLSLRSRILMALVGLVAVAIGVVLVVQDIRQQAVLLAQEKNHGTVIARSIAAASATPLLTYNYVSLQQLAERSAQEGHVEYVVILDKEGTVAGYSGKPQIQGKHLHDEFSRNARETNETLIQEVPGRFPGVRSGLDIAIPVFIEGSPQKWGIVRVGLSLEPVYAEVNRTRAWILGLGFGVLILSILVARLLSHRITKPLERLVEATGELAKGNFDYRVALRTGDEIGSLSKKFDEMATIIREKQSEVASTNRELAALNAGLEEKVAERARELAEAEKKYRLLFEQSPNPICIIQEGFVRFFNEAFCVAFGYSSQELGERDWEFVELLDESHQDEMREALGISVSSFEAAVSLETVGKHKNGGLIYLDMRAIQITYEGAPALEAILGDVTEQKHVHDQIVSSERLRALGEMAGGVAHDFNNVLGAILGRAQLLQRRDLDEEIAKGLRIIEKAAQDGSATVQRIQEFSRVRTDQEFAPIELGPMLEDVIEMTRSRWEDEAQRTGKTIRVERELARVSPVDGNISELRELFMNFILNAVDAIEVEGTITVGSGESDGRIQVTINDDGHGMSSEVQKKLFDPFFTTKGSGGVGLGMSIAYGTIQRHGGEVKVSSAEGSGTTFTISFPASTRRGKEDTDLGRLFDGAGRILVVDDEEDVRELVKDILIEGGYEAETADGGAEALAMLEENNYELVITDLGMPGVGGWDVARGCRDISPGTSVALLTGWGATVDNATAEELGIEKVLKKPFEMMELLATVQEILGKRGLAESA